MLYEVITQFAVHEAKPAADLHEPGLPDVAAPAQIADEQVLERARLVLVARHPSLVTEVAAIDDRCEPPLDRGRAPIGGPAACSSRARLERRRYKLTRWRCGLCLIVADRCSRTAVARLRQACRRVV